MLKKITILYSSQIYRAIIPLIFVPYTIGILGAENYGLVSFFTMLIGLIGILDAGIGSAFIKIVSTNRFNQYSFQKVISLFLKVFFIFLIIACIIIVSFYFSSDYIVIGWLKTSINYPEAIYCIKLIGIILSIMYLKSFVSSFINGMERQDILALWGIIYTTLFYCGSYLAIKNVSNDLYTFFKIILFVSILDFSIISFIWILLVFFNIKLTKKKINETTQFDKIADEFSLLKIAKFSLQLSGLSIIWIIATQIDKVVLSKYLILEEYANYQIAAQLATTISIFTVPLTQFLLPRLSVLYKDKNEKEFLRIYNISLFVFVALLSPIIPYFFLFGDDIISLWIRSDLLGANINGYAKWLIAAALIAGIMNFVFIILYAQGKLKNHFYAYIIYSSLTIPLSVLIAKYYGAVISAKFVFIHSLLFMIFWGGYCVHKLMNKFINFFALIFGGVFILSTSIFYIFSNTKYITSVPILDLFIPPLINFFITLLIYFLVKRYIHLFFSKITLN
ncbi:lipopolysaccharide biosynthesis protein [Limnobaculum xujianqingii]|uniref:lipopolysaccharide biosynthesis protein n=1 Tax=Limnobaculum xujianqingii TaxID=2738837 RepID=UPI0011266991|nr:oligosaccharide flippase family protein [Limnobaculum xujianqingii]